MTGDFDTDRDRQERYDGDFQQMYQYFTSASVNQASDKVFSATSEELAESYRPDDYSV